VRLQDIVRGKPSAVYVTTTATVEETARLLARKRFRSVPVWDEEEARYVAFIDEVDLMEYAAVLAHSWSPEHLTTQIIRERYSQFSEEEVRRLSFGNGTVADILKLPGEDRRRVHVFESQALLINAMKIIKDYERVLVRHIDTSFAKTLFSFAKFASRVYRTIDFKICTQTDILRFLVNHLSKDIHEEEFRGAKVRDCGRFHPIISITVNDRAIDGFLKMIESGINACAVLDHEGRILASLSPSDLRGLTSQKLKYILYPVMQFFVSMTGVRADHPLTCKAGEDLLQTMKKIVRASTRRCWVVDDYYRPIGLLGMGLIINYVVTKPCKHF